MANVRLLKTVIRQLEENVGVNDKSRAFAWGLIALELNKVTEEEYKLAGSNRSPRFELAAALRRFALNMERIHAQRTYHSREQLRGRR